MTDYAELAEYLPELKRDLRVTLYEQVQVHARVAYLQDAVDGMEGLMRQSESLPDDNERTS